MILSLFGFVNLWILHAYALGFIEAKPVERPGITIAADGWITDNEKEGVLNGFRKSRD